MAALSRKVVTRARVEGSQATSTCSASVTYTISSYARPKTRRCAAESVRRAQRAALRSQPHGDLIGGQRRAVLDTCLHHDLDTFVEREVARIHRHRCTDYAVLRVEDAHVPRAAFGYTVDTDDHARAARWSESGG